ncbi:class I SAM-dependent methyltransferase [Bacillus manliponensis]|uniref:class I SAM-dependent methyltransferase n=1 Tax=Bacillus manliponensis TaxID=574376 RepID=UPI00351992C2
MKDVYFDYLVKQAEAPFEGWDFSFISGTGRMNGEALPWSYMSKVLKERTKEMHSMLDMGTGGGEFFSMLMPFPPNTAATEAYPPNMSIAKNRLEPLGVKVCEIECDEELPFADQEFDLILNQHESYSECEVKRILHDDGTFITQQVGGEDCNDLNRLLQAEINPEFLHWNLDYAVKKLEKEGFTITEKDEAFPLLRFYDVGAIIYYLKAIPWQVPDFSVEQYEEKLREIHHYIEENGYVEIKTHRFYIVAKKRL